MPFYPSFRYGVNVCGASSLRAKVPMPTTRLDPTALCRGRNDEEGAPPADPLPGRHAAQRDVVKKRLDRRMSMPDTNPPEHSPQPPSAAQPSAGDPAPP